MAVGGHLVQRFKGVAVACSLTLLMMDVLKLTG